MNIKNRMKNLLIKLKVFFNPTREEFMISVFFIAFFPLPSYFIAGKGLVPPFFTAVTILAYIVPFISGVSLFLVLLYVVALPLIAYVGALGVCRLIKNKYTIWGIACALGLIAGFVPIYIIFDTAGVAHTYNAIALYKDIF